MKQGIGAYQCDYGTEKSWIVSIEPTAQRKNLDQNATSVVSLQTRIMTLEETKTFYSKANPVSAISPKKAVINSSSTKNMKHQTDKEIEAKKKLILKKNQMQKKRRSLYPSLPSRRQKK